MDVGGVTTRLQKDTRHLKQEMTKLQVELSQWDTKLGTRLKEFKEEFHGELKLELQGLFKQYLGNLVFAYSATPSIDRGKGVLGGPPSSFALKDRLPISPTMELGGMGTPSRSSSLEIISRPHKLKCPRFDGLYFLGWCA
ncbi:hypothetical protein PVK06_035702 [Gossypium arboreum]|uniref:Uncharacterized protein n=1 Tax=Gossypium arboreum TaxID=29729 RepID=A0ABR0NHJ1_GOSAR|nr:hypothetical protein PVK06_035702 [Gossypium arboreum]